MEENVLLVVGIAISIASAVVCNLIAKSRHGKHVYWGAMGFLFGPFAIPFAFFARPVRGRDNSGPQNP